VKTTSCGICIHYDLRFVHECSDRILENLNFYSVRKTIFLNMSSIWHYTILSLHCVLHILFTNFGLRVSFQKVNIKLCGYIIFCCLSYNVSKVVTKTIIENKIEQILLKIRLNKLKNPQYMVKITPQKHLNHQNVSNNHFRIYFHITDISPLDFVTTHLIQTMM